MAFHSAYDPTNNGRQLSSKLWRHFNPPAMYGNPGAGYFWFEDFHNQIGAYVDGALVQNTAGTALTTTYNARCLGALTVDAGSTTDTQGPNITWDGLGFTPAGGTKFAIEWRLEMDMIASMDLFFGAGTLADTSIISTTTIAATDAIGFLVADQGAGATFTAVNSGGTVSVTTNDVATFVANTQIKIGFLIDGTDSVEVYTNGEKQLTTGLSMAAIPDSVIYPKLEVRAGAGSVQPTATIDWMCVGFEGQV